MSTYISQIASRATKTITAALHPAVDYRFAQQNTGNPRQGEPEEVVYPSSSQDKPSQDFIASGKVQSIAHKENMKNPIQDKNSKKHRVENSDIVADYFLKHVERSTLSYEQPMVQVPTKRDSADLPTATELPGSDNHMDQRKILPVAERSARFQPAEEDQRSKTQPLPAAKDEKHSKMKERLKPTSEKVYLQLKKNHYPVTLMKPSQEPVENSDANSRKSNKQVPKLVIGKITVEVLPAEKPAKPKVITRIIQDTPASDSFKANKLSFGLGQL